MADTISKRLAAWAFDQLLERVVMVRSPDFVIGLGNPDGAYLNRWALTPWWAWQQRLQARARAVPTLWNRKVYHLAQLLPNLYLHEFLRDDDDRALHDHPSFAWSWVLANGYIEHQIAYGGVHVRRAFEPGSFRFLALHHAHRIELYRNWRDGNPVRCWSLFFFGPRLRRWGFHCPERGWIPWEEFTAADDPGKIGRGCD